MNRASVRLLRLVVPFGGWMALAAGLGAATVASGIGLMATSAYLISAAALHPSVADLGVAIVGVRFFGLARGVFRYLERYVSHSVNFRLLARLRVWFYQAVEPLAPARLLDFKSGDLLSRAVADIETLQDFYVRVVAPPVVALVIALGLGAFVGSFDPTIAVILLVFFGLAGLGLPLLIHTLAHRPGRRQVAVRADLHAALVDDIQGLADLVANGQEGWALARLNSAAANYAHLQRQSAWVAGLQSGLSSLLQNAGLWAVLAAGVALVSAGRLNGLYLAVLVLAAAAGFEAVSPLPQAAQSLAAALAAARRLFELADTPPAAADPPAPTPAPRTGRLEIRGLSFAYSPKAPLALSDIHFYLAPGRRVAVVGPSGAGKSTLANLLLRFWDCPAGQIWLDGRDLRAYAAADVRCLVAVVSQQTHLFNAAIGENIRLARPEASQAEVTRAAQQAQLHDFIVSLPEQYATWIGERGVRLSAGQRQRLAVARALLRAAPILLLDEPTANLDPVTERAVLRSLLEVANGPALLLITHRLVGLETFDEILVLSRGRLVQRGRHADLVGENGVYRRLWELQNRAQIAGHLASRAQTPGFWSSQAYQRAPVGTARERPAQELG